MFDVSNIDRNIHVNDPLTGRDDMSECEASPPLPDDPNTSMMVTWGLARSLQIAADRDGESF